uniref:Uncharacterized protein n=1 Tax=Rhizophora mucronata TaxID=61149 RepID=A0A2P2QSF1_RHIMU
MLDWLSERSVVLVGVTLKNINWLTALIIHRWFNHHAGQ